MDSVTQFVLGASIGHVVMGKQLGRTASIVGGVLATLPDLDVFYPFADDVADFTWHRGYSHSLFVMTIATPLFAALFWRLWPRASCHKWRTLSTVFLCFTTHAVLDACTVYGTQLWLPFSDHPVALSTVFVIDPLYTLPLLVGVLLTLCSPRSTRAAGLALALSSVYLLTSFIIRIHVDTVAQKAMAMAELSNATHLSIAAPFTTLLWRIVVVDEDNYYNGYYSLFDTGGPIPLLQSPRNLHEISAVVPTENVSRLIWFTRGFYSLEHIEDRLVLKDLRMGFPPNYVFMFDIAERRANTWQLIEPRARQGKRDLSALRWVWRRIWSPAKPPANE